MSDEATIRASLSIRMTSSGVVQKDYQSRPTSANMDISSVKGPTPGDLTIPVGGKVVSLQEIQNAGLQPGPIWMMNRSATNYVIYGMRDPATNKFVPIGELLPGVPTVMVMWRFLLEQYDGTGTGTSAAIDQFFMKAIGGDCIVAIEAHAR